MSAWLRKREMASLPLALAPTVAAASGGEILALLWGEIALLAVVVGSCFVRRLPLRVRLGALLVYLVWAAVANGLVAHMSHSDNGGLIALCVIGLPALTWIGALVGGLRLSRTKSH
jgi:hypothetical protein